MGATYEVVESPVGPLHLVERGGRLCQLAFDGRFDRPADARSGSVSAAGALRAYFAGDLDAIDGLEVSPAGTEFQRAVWHALRSIPRGTTMSYGQLAAAVGRPTAMRAVGAANGQNPVAIVLPCHRVIGASGKLTGYGGGLERKRWLLAHEGAIASDLFAQPAQ